MINAEIRIISPILVGSGEYMDFKYLYRTNGKFRIVDFDRTADIILSSRMAKAITDRILNKIKLGERDWQDIWEDLDRHNLIFLYEDEIEAMSSDLGKKTTNIIMYAGMPVWTGERMSFKPYIPGSTIKGSIRNAILYKYIKSYGHVINRNEYSNIFKDAFRISLREKGTIDVMKYIMVSDFISDDVKLGIGRIERKNLMNSRPSGRFQPAIFIKSGIFKGSISINRDVFLEPAEKFESIRGKLRSLLGEDIFQGLTPRAPSKVMDERLMLSCEKLLEEFTRDVDGWLRSNYPRMVDISDEPNMYIGFGKGINRNTPAVSLPLQTASQVFRFRRGRYPPSTMPFVRVSDLKYLPLGRAMMKHV